MAALNCPRNGNERSRPNHSKQTNGGDDLHFGLRASADSLNFLNNKIDKVVSKIGFEVSLIVIEAIRGRCASFMILTATVSEIGPIWWTDKLIYFSSRYSKTSNAFLCIMLFIAKSNGLVQFARLFFRRIEGNVLDTRTFLHSVRHYPLIMQFETPPGAT